MTVKQIAVSISVEKWQIMRHCITEILQNIIVTDSAIFLCFVRSEHSFEFGATDLLGGGVFLFANTN